MAFPSPGCLAEWRANLPPMRERWVGGATAFALIFTLWFLAGMPPTSVLISVGLALFAFGMMFFPMPGAESKALAKDNFSRLLRFPGFWLGILLFAFMLCQYLNPAYEVVLVGKAWNVRYLGDHCHWLPSGIRAPFGFTETVNGMNPLRQMCIFGSAWLILCTLWCGLRSRRVRTWLIWALTLNAVLLAVFCLLRWSNDLTKEFLGYKTGTSSFFGVFSYKNHAAQFFVLSFSMAVSLALMTWRRNAEKFKKSGAHILLAVLSLALWIAALCTASFAGVAEAAAWVLIVPVLIFSSGLMRRTTWIAGGIVSLMVAGLAAVWFSTADMDATWSKVETKFAKIKKEEIDDRKPRRELALTIFTRSDERERFGWGAGSFQWIAPYFQANMPEFLNAKGKLKTRSEFAHCDCLQMLAEWGYLGAGIFFAGVLWFFAVAVKNIRRWRVPGVALMCGIVFFAAHSTMDFVSYNPALLQTLAVVVVAFRWSLKRKALPNPVFDNA